MKKKTAAVMLIAILSLLAGCSPERDRISQEDFTGVEIEHKTHYYKEDGDEETKEDMKSETKKKKETKKNTKKDSKKNTGRKKSTAKNTKAEGKQG